MLFWSVFAVTFFVLYNMCNIGAVMHWCFDCTNKCHSNYFMYMSPIGHMDWIGLDLENWTHVQLWHTPLSVFIIKITVSHRISAVCRWTCLNLVASLSRLHYEQRRSVALCCMELKQQKNTHQLQLRKCRLSVSCVTTA